MNDQMKQLPPPMHTLRLKIAFVWNETSIIQQSDKKKKKRGVLSLLCNSHLFDVGDYVQDKS